MSSRNPLSLHTSKLGTQKLWSHPGTPKLAAPSPTPIPPGLPLKPGLSAAGGSSELPDVQQHRKPLECHFFFPCRKGTEHISASLWGRAVFCFQSSASQISAFWGMPGRRESPNILLWGAGGVFWVFAELFPRLWGTLGGIELCLCWISGQDLFGRAEF